MVKLSRRRAGIVAVCICVVAAVAAIAAVYFGPPGAKPQPTEIPDVSESSEPLFLSVELLPALQSFQLPHLDLLELISLFERVDFQS